MNPIDKSYSRYLALLPLFLITACASNAGPNQNHSLALEAPFRERVQALSADRMEGRSPSSLGEARTVAYLTEEYRRIGLQPANGQSFSQPVPLVSVTAENITPLEINGPDSSKSLAFGEDMMVWTKRLTSKIELSGSELVFAGYGIVAPEHDWNDYAGLDVKGKTVVVLVNDPGFATQDSDVFNGNTMTYYGRWTYKYEEAAKQGASGILIVHETAAAGYPWQVVTGGWTGEQFDLVAADKNMSRVRVEGWLSQDAATEVFAMAGQSYADLRDAAKVPGFKAVPLGLDAAVSFTNSIRQSESQNVVGYLPGSERPDEYIVYSAHWDHLGLAPEGEDRIFNGAKDNAAGTAMMLGIAEEFAKGKRPERSVVFLAVTAEESGLLGSAWYGSNPLFPLEKTVANINIDAPTLIGPTNDVVLVGKGSSELEDILEKLAKEQDRVLVQEPTPEKGFFYRSDHFNFSKRGVPVIYAKGGTDHREKGSEYGLAWDREYVSQRYHKVSDEYDPNWDLRGLVEDLQLLHRLGSKLANSKGWPNWYKGNEFRAIRDASSDQR